LTSPDCRRGRLKPHVRLPRGGPLRAYLVSG
jgi:hypothetical protein